MILNSLKLYHFKNYREVNMAFSTGINCILGRNGMGKTNLLDAVYYLSMTRSALNTADLENIQRGASFFSIIGEFVGTEKKKVNCYFEQGKKKLFKVNDQEPPRLSDHIGTIPSVLTTPDDNELIKEGSETRRKLFDAVICQHNREYLHKLTDYQRILKQRNGFLKHNEGNNRPDRTLLAVYDEQMIPLSLYIAGERQKFVETFSPYFHDNYSSIFSGQEQPRIDYQSDCLQDHYADLYHKALERDLILLRTTMGCHRDDYVFLLNEQPIKKFGSQGQQKSFTIALKLAEYDFLRALKETDPLLLLDDLFDKLDDDRIKQLVTLLSDQERFSQIFITDARTERARSFFDPFPNVRFFQVEDGTIHE